jgi:Flp pilus assembly protein TadG
MRDRSGAYAIMMALSLPVLIGLMGLGTDYGIWTYSHQQMQAATDAAAVTGAAAYTSGGSAPVVAQVNAITTSYGFTPGQAGVVVTVNRPPTKGSYAGNASAVEVIAQQPSNLLFAAFWLNDAPLISTRSVAMANAANGCVLALDPTAKAAVSAQGTTQVTLNNCSLISDSASTTAVSAGGSAQVQALSVDAVGGISGLAGISTTQGTVTGISPIADPFADVQMPSFSGCASHNLKVKTTTTISPGVYCGGISVNAGASLTLSPGIYFIDQGSLTVNGGGTLIGHGVTIIFTSSSGSNYATASFSGGATVDLSPPTSGTTAGIVLFGDRGMPVGTAFNFNGGASQSLTGSVYLPKAALTYAGGSNATNACIKIVADTITFTGNSNLSIDCSAYPTRAIGVSAGKLVE